MSEDKMMIRKHSAMIQTNVKELTLTQRKLINYLIMIAQKTGKKELYKTTISNIKESCNIGKTENIDLKDQLRKLTDIKIEFNYVNKDKNEVWQIMSLLASAEVIQNTGIVEFEFSVKLLDKVLNPSIYAPLSVSLISCLKSSYSIVLYEFLRDYVGSPSVPKLLVKEFKSLMGIKEFEYSLFKDFKKRVLDIAVKEVNEKTDINCEYQLLKEHGNLYSHIQFTVIKKDFQLMLGYEPIIKDEENKQVEIKTNHLPKEIADAIYEKHRTKSIIELITRYLDKGIEYIVSNIKYSIKNAKDNFPAYLRQALEKDYAGHDREVKSNIEKKQKEITRQKEEKERKSHQEKVDLEQIIKLMEGLPKNRYEELERQAKKALKTREPNNEFATNKTSVILEMARIYKCDPPSSYGEKDFD